MATFIAFSQNRGTVTINDNFANGFENAVLAHDCWKSYFETKSKTHQICTAYLLRELNYFEERYQPSWATAFKNMKEVCTFQKRIIRYKNYLFTFLYYHEVPPDNNTSERAIRNIKIKQKVSGQFKTQRGPQIYAIIRSVTDTCNKNGQNVLFAFHTIVKLHPE